ncbi:gamma-glutamyltransferase [Ancylobacter pratisalsi]|uniref:Glutathione hydrolase proenzyme n=1 Tax=Ancylobacter pratisalsi TaxID=1745854 RepID=A0A6P1YS89_9HYPH|nr:gamma-glutamyltransferase [Ancylobacter pratisalsi]QIB35566.1 gamma-glutamyltransferase [Ancylobacter pratisalsi]
MRDFETPGRSLVMATHGMAATSHPLASLIALNVLQAGGNAMDAAIAACAVQGVVEPGSTGLGGDCFVLYSRGGTDDIVAYNGSGRAPAAASTAYFADHGITAIERQSAHAVTVPGAVEAWARLTQDHGTRSLGELLQPAIALAREGYAVAPRVGLDWREQSALLEKDANAARIFLPGGHAPHPGTLHQQPKLAATLERIAEDGPDGFYRGAVAQDIVGYLQGLGGLHTLEDFAATRGAYVTPISAPFRDVTVHECPPNGQGVIALMLLNILSRATTDSSPLTVERVHFEMEAARLAYSVRDAVLSDPDHSQIPLRELLSDTLAAQLAGMIRADKRLEELPVVDLPSHDDTVYIAVVDKDRNVASFINSIFTPFGSGLVAPRSGVLLNNRAQGFSLKDLHPNAIAGGKRPLHTIIPGLTTREGRIEHCFGVMGGQYQALGQAYFLARILDYGLDMQSAIDLPRASPLFGTDALEVEASMPEDIQRGLAALGHRIVRPARPIGGAQAIRIDWNTGVLTGASDPRKDGCALGY